MKKILASLLATLGIFGAHTVTGWAAGWHMQFSGATSGKYVKAFDVATDPSGDVVAVGRVANTGIYVHDFTVVRLDASSGGEQWRREISVDADDAARAVAIDSLGAVIAAGRLGGFAIVKLDGATGADVWSTVIEPAAHGWVKAIALDATGDIAAAGGIVGENTTDFAVAKVDGSTGAELWRRVIDGGETDPNADRRDEAQAVLVDAAGDVIAGGWLRKPGIGLTFTVIKFAGVTGAEVWRQELSPSGRVRALALGPGGDVFAAGQLLPGSPTWEFVVVRLEGASGNELWRQTLTGEETFWNAALAVAADGAGDVVAAGALNNSATREDFAVVKLSGITGAELWRSELRSAYIQSDAANAVAIDADDNVVAVGRVSRRRRAPAHGFTVVKLEGATGNRMWLRELDATVQGLATFDEAFAVDIDSVGDVAAAGVIDEDLSGVNFAVVKLGGADGLTVGDCAPAPRSDCTSTAEKSRISINDRSVAGPDPDRRDKLTWSWIGGPAVPFDSLGHMAGATDLRLCIYDDTAGVPALAASFVVPGGGTCGIRSCWRRIGRADDPLGYTYKDKQLINDGIRKLAIRTAKTSSPRLVLTGRGGGLLLPGAVSSATYFRQDPSVTVQLVTTHGLCWDAVYAAGTETKNDSSGFRARCEACP